MKDALKTIAMGVTITVIGMAIYNFGVEPALRRKQQETTPSPNSTSV